MKKLRALLHLSPALFLLISACQPGETPSSTHLPDLGSYVAAYVPQVIGSREPVRIRFAQPVVEDSLLGTVVSKDLYAFSPGTPGQATWEDAYTFRFIPEQKFRPGSNYTLTMRLGSLFPAVEPDYRSVNFNFSIRPVQLSVLLDPPGPADSDVSLQMIRGQITSSEPINGPELERVLEVKYRGNVLTPQWEHSENGMGHNFTIPDLKRGERDEKITISWDGRPLDSPSHGITYETVPAIGVFKVTGISTVQEGSSEVQLVFSDYLDPKFNLTGMIQVNNSDHGFETRVDKHRLSVFPDADITGEFTLVLDAGIRSVSGRTLSEAKTYRLSFEDIKPQVEMLGKGNIVPHSREVILPFRAVNLSAVEIEIFEIFESNVMQFLQYGELWQSNGYEAVGRVVGRHLVSLKSLRSDVARNQWQRYAVDLSSYTDVHPGSIYEVRIGFRKSFSMYHCSDTETHVQDEVAQDTSSPLWQYYYWYDDYNYENRDDPCQREYYTADHFARRNVLASNLGISAMSGSDNSFEVSVHDLRTTESISSCNLQMYDYQQQLITEGRTSADGSCVLKASRTPAFIIAEFQGEKGYLKVMDGVALNVSDFDVSGATSQDGMKGYIYGDRDVWRPGDTIFLNFILQTEKGRSVDHPVTCTVYNPRGQKRYSQTLTTHVGPMYAFPVPTESSDPTGNWRTEIQVGGVKFNKTLKIETIKPNRLKIAIDTEGPIEAWKRETNLALNAQWLHGAPASGLEAQVELGLIPMKTQFKGFGRYQFDDPARHVDPAITTVFKGELDQAGHAQVTIPHDSKQLYPGKMRANIKSRVFEKGGEYSTDQFSEEWWPYQAYAGISIQNNRWGYKQLKENTDNTIDLVAVDGNGDPLKGRELSVGVYHADWSWWWNDNQYELAQFNSAQHLGAITQGTATTTGDGKAEFVYRPLEYGLYLIRVCDTQSGHCSGEYAYAGYFYGDEDGRTAAAKLTLSSDKAGYAPGDQVQLTIPSAPGSLVLVSIEKENAVLSTQHLRAQGDVTPFVFTATGQMAPNVYAHVTLIQPHNLDENDMPLRMYGIVPIMVEDPSTKLTPVITMPDVLKPETSFEVSVSEMHKQEMAYTIAIVDEGLLDLTRFKTPDPWNHFYAKQALGVRTWDVYDNVLGALGGPVERILAIGGDGSGVKIQAVNEVNRFKPVVMHLGPFVLKPGEKATHTLAMPNYVGSVRAMVVAAAGDRYGNAEKAVPVKSPVMILASLPRVLSPGERVSIPVNVFAMDDKIKKVDITIRGNDKILISGNTKTSVIFDKQGDQLVNFSAEVAQQIGTGEVWIEASSGRENASQHVEIEIRNPNPYISDITEMMLQKGEKWEHKYKDIGMSGTNEAILELSSLFPANLDERLRYLIHYPYGCLEQTTSSAFPQLYVDQLMELSGTDRARIQRNVSGAITRIARYLTPSGGLSYWPGGNTIHEWTNSYAGHFLVEAQRLGYSVDGLLLDRWKAFQSTRAQNFALRDSKEDDILNQAYRLYTLVLSGNPELGAMNRLRNASNLDATSRYMLAAAYAGCGQGAVAQELISTPVAVKEYNQPGATFGSETRDRALIVEALVSIGAFAQALPIARRIADEMDSGRWYSTQTTAFAVLALAKFSSTQEHDDLYFNFQVAGGKAEIVRQKKSIYQQRLPDDKSNTVFVENLSNAPLYVRLVRRGQPLDPPKEPVQKNILLEVTYQDMSGKTLNPARLTQGTDFIMSVTVKNPATYSGTLDALALQNMLPSGWEIVNQRLDILGDRLKSDAAQYQDFRDDRVYTFFDLYGRASKTYRVALNAAYVGKYIQPAVYCEAMYDHAIQASISGGWVEVIPDQMAIAKADVNTEN